MTSLGFGVVEAADGKEALRVLESSRADLAIVDVMMPRMDGWDLCRELKGFCDIPVLMLTAKAETAQKVKGLNLGADDYLVKPFEPAELQARVRALLRRYKIQSAQSVHIGNVTLDRVSFTVTRGGENLTLPLKEFELLFKLASYPGKTFSRDALIQDLWGSDFDGTERTVDVHINRLRDRFPEGSSGFRVVTIRGLGYRLEVTT